MPPPQPNGGKVTPNLAMDAEATRMLNLTVLQRLDPAVEDILITAAHVTLYDFNIDLNQWSRKDVEGSLFVVKRNTQPRFQFIVMNRRNTDNLVEDLLSDFEYELQPPYLLYRNAAQEVNGIWFYNQHDCEAVASLFGRILNAYVKVPPKPKVPSTKSEFEELEAVPTSAAIDGPLEPPPSSTALVSDTPDESLANYFNGAATIGSVSSAPMAGRTHPSTESIASSHVPLMVPAATPAHQIPHPLGGSSAPPLPLHDANARVSHSTNLLTPAFFAPPSPSLTSVAPPVSSVMPTAPPLHPNSASAQPPPYGTPLLQPFPPPTPPPSLTPAHNDGPVISRDKVKDALQRLVQSDEFIDLIYRELQNAHM
ncbi:mRNA-decapping enzyme-like protein [Phragmites australis]|uniref:mRNA-decapping enzyme-like protein n=1 Tax=Phragmites australis TaxID=29695 RepID=UPI002D76DCB7|nr:mRNA-decapping enzyme-like protein [Phragmites australis]